MVEVADNALVVLADSSVVEPVDSSAVEVAHICLLLHFLGDKGSTRHLVQALRVVLAANSFFLNRNNLPF